MQFEIKNHRTGSVLFTAELSADYNHRPRSMQLGAAVQMAVQTGASLRDADLGGANLWGANMWGADLEGVDLRNADLRIADLGGANLRDANLDRANLGGANLRGADLEGVGLDRANLKDADMRDANLEGANPWGADLRYAKLEGAKLEGANLRIYHGIYSVIVTPSHVHIGRERWTPEQWLALTEGEALAIEGERAVEVDADGPVIKAMIEQMRPDLTDQPADAGDHEPHQPADGEQDQPRPRCTHTRLTKDRCPVCGKLDDDNRPVGDEPAQDGEGVDPYTQGYSDGYLEGFERGMRHAPEYWLETAARIADRNGHPVTARAIRQGDKE